MRYILTIITTFVLSCKMHEQNPSEIIFDCNQKMMHISEFWIKDSLANNGYRYEVLMNRPFSKCTGKLLKSSVLTYLGKPDEIDTIGNKDYLRINYNCLNPQNFEKESPISKNQIIHYISFVVPIGSDTIEEISIGHGDY